MKRAICLLTALLTLALTAVPALGAESAEVDALLAHLAALLDVREQILERELPLYDAVDLFLERNDYPSLLAARVTGDEATRGMAEIPVPAMTLSSDDLLALMRRGVETDVVEVAIMAVPGEISFAAGNTSTFESLLFVDVYQISGLPMVEEWLAYGRGKAALDVAYDLAAINYLLIPVADDPAVMAFWDSIEERWPLIGQWKPVWESEQDVLLIRTTEILDDIEGELDWASSALGRANYAIDLQIGRINDLDMDALRADVNIISGLPPLVSLPRDWCPLQQMKLTASYDEGAEGGMPSVLVLGFKDVSAAAFKRYIDDLRADGLSLYRWEESDDGALRVGVALGDVAILMDWLPDGSVHIAYMPELISLEDFWYVDFLQ